MVAQNGYGCLFSLRVASSFVDASGELNGAYPDRIWCAKTDRRRLMALDEVCLNDHSQ